MEFDVKFISLCLLALFSCTMPADLVQAEQEAVEEDIERTRQRVEAYRLLRDAWQTYMRADEAHFAEYDLLPVEGEVEMPKEARKLYNKAIELAEAALGLFDELPDAHLIIANSHHNFDEPEKTERHYSLAIAIDPARDDILSARVGIRIELKDLPGATADVARLKELNSEFADFAEKELERAQQDS